MKVPKGASRALEGNVFYEIATFHTINKLKIMLKNAGLQILEIRSTILQHSSKEPLHTEPSKEGCHVNTGFVAIKLKRQ